MCGITTHLHSNQGKRPQKNPPILPWQCRCRQHFLVFVVAVVGFLSIDQLSQRNTFPVRKFLKSVLDLLKPETPPLHVGRTHAGCPSQRMMPWYAMVETLLYLRLYPTVVPPDYFTRTIASNQATFTSQPQGASWVVGPPAPTDSALHTYLRTAPASLPPPTTRRTDLEGLYLGRADKSHCDAI